jgi:hypothetical protein
MSIAWPWAKPKQDIAQQAPPDDPVTSLMFTFQRDFYTCQREKYELECLINEMLQHRGVFLAGGRPTRYDLIDAGLLPQDEQ